MIEQAQSIPPSRSRLTTAGGVLSIVGGGVALAIGLVLLALAVGSGISQGWHDAAAPLGTFFFFGFWLLVTGGLAVAGGISALKRRNWGLALAGAIAALLTGNTLLGILSIVITALSKKEFN